MVVRESASVRDALAAIDRGTRGIALLVDGEGRLVGTISDGDVRRAILRGAGLESHARDVACRQFVFVGPDADRAHVLDLMKARTIQQVPIVDESGRLLGMHSLREILGRVERPNTAVIMAGGRGERLRPLTDTVPKPMLPIAGRPILEWLVLHLVGFGIRRIQISVNYLGQVIERHFGDGEAFGCEIGYLREERPLGTGGSLSLLREKPNEPLLVMNGDLVTRFDVGEILDVHDQSGAAITLAVHEYRHTVPFGVVTVDGERVVGLREKPAETWLANAGIYVLEPSVVERVPSERVVHLPEFVEETLERGEHVVAYRLSGDWADVGRPADLSRACGKEGA
ncbi:MAG: nucleotidyltransferase family protein [Thermoanaerobaculia bacterium]